MFSMKPATLFLVSLALSSTSQGWEMKFWDTDTCGADAGDTSNSGESCVSDCHYVALTNMRTIMITDWDDGCRLQLWGQGDSCIGPIGEPYLDVSKDEAEEQGIAIFDETGTKACLKNVLTDPINDVGYTCG